MGKSRKHKAKSSENLHELKKEILEGRAESDLAARNYRRAEEWLKELCRRDRATYLQSDFADAARWYERSCPSE